LRFLIRGKGNIFLKIIEKYCGKIWRIPQQFFSLRPKILTKTKECLREPASKKKTNKLEYRRFLQILASA
jgi:hypothetical protein